MNNLWNGNWHNHNDYIILLEEIAWTEEARPSD